MVDCVLDEHIHQPRKKTGNDTRFKAIFMSLWVLWQLTGFLRLSLKQMDKISIYSSNKKREILVLFSLEKIDAIKSNFFKKWNNVSRKLKRYDS